MMANKNDYRLCVVTNAIKKPTLVNFIWSAKEDAWVSDADPDIKLIFDIRPTYLAYVE